MLTKKRWISLCMTVILLLCCMPVIPAQADGFEDIRVEYPVCVPYGLYNKYIKLNGPIVKSGDSVLQNNVDYTYSYSFDSRQMELGLNETLTVTGIGDYAGFSRTYPVAVVKEDMVNCAANVSFGTFQAMPLEANLRVTNNGETLNPNVHYQYLEKDNVNVGTATARVVGTGDYFYGYQDVKSEISLDDNMTVKLPGAYLGQADGTLTDTVYYGECYIPASYVRFEADTDSDIVFVCTLYEVVGEELIQIGFIETSQGSPSRNSLQHNFFNVYEESADEGGKLYALAYYWQEPNLATYAGAVILGVIAKVGPATQLEMEHIENDGDFRSEYFNAVGTDGVVESVVWESSNTNVATVEDGIVTMKTPGTATITARFGELETTAKVTATAMDIREASLFHFDGQTGKAAVIYENRLLTETVDYTLSVEQEDGHTSVTVSGCGLFEGQLLQQYDTSGEAVGHTHTFGYACATKCDSCDFTRTAEGHTAGSKWFRDGSGHWHVCKLCGEKQDYEAHTMSEPDTCAVCGGLNLPGDMNDDYEVTDADAVYLLRYTLFGDSYPITRNGDFNGDSTVTDADAIYLLRHTLFGDSYPIQ